MEKAKSGIVLSPQTIGRIRQTPPFSADSFSFYYLVFTFLSVKQLTTLHLLFEPSYFSNDQEQRHWQVFLAAQVLPSESMFEHEISVNV